MPAGRARGRTMLAMPGDTEPVRLGPWMEPATESGSMRRVDDIACGGGLTCGEETVPTGCAAVTGR